MNENLSELIRWFPSGTAEGERKILDSAFVYIEEFANIISPPPGNPYLLVGPKGSGKSAIIEFALRSMTFQSVPCIVLTPADFHTSTISDNDSTGDMIRRFSEEMFSAIAAKISEDRSILKFGDSATLYDEAVRAERRSPSFIGKMSRFMANIATSSSKIDLNSAFSHLNKKTKLEIGIAIARTLREKSFFIFVDDTDQIANPEKRGHINRIWSLLLAVRRISASIPELRVIVSLRSEVWERIKRDPAGQRDQTDHFESLRISLRTNREHVQRIIERRLSLASDALHYHAGKYDLFFEGNSACAPHSEEARAWRDLISVRSRGRPRDAIQMMNSLARRAIQNKKLKIDESIFQVVIPEFSKKISEEFGHEFSAECPNALEILRSFASIGTEYGSFMMNAEQALEFFKRVPSRFSVSLYGHALGAMNESDAFELWRFFYLCGVINVRVSDVTEADGYRHLDPEDEPAFISKARWNDLQKALFEVNPAFRDFLIQVGEDRAKMSGLPVRLIPRLPKKKRNRDGWNE